MKRKNVISMLALAMTAISLFTACKKDDDETTTPVAGSGKLMAVHASPDAPGVDLLLDNTKINTDPVVFTNATGYLAVTSGIRNVKVNVAGSTTTVLNANVNIVNGKNYSLFVVDEVANLDTLLIEDNLAAPAAGKAHVRFIHLSPDAPAVDIALANGGAVVFGNKSFKDFTAFTPLDAGTYDLEVRVAGTQTVALPLPGISLTAGKIYTVYAKGFLGGTGAQALGAEIIVNN